MRSEPDYDLMRVDTKSRVVIPSRLRKKLGIGGNDRVLMCALDGKLVMKKFQPDKEVRICQRLLPE